MTGEEEPQDGAAEEEAEGQEGAGENFVETDAMDAISSKLAKLSKKFGADKTAAGAEEEVREGEELPALLAQWACDRSPANEPSWAMLEASSLLRETSPPKRPMQERIDIAKCLHLATTGFLFGIRFCRDEQLSLHFGAQL